MHIFTKMLKPIKEIIKIPEGVNVEISPGEIKISQNGKETIKKFPVKIEKKENELILEEKKPNKKDKKLIKTAVSHIKNMINGMEKSYVYKLQICSAHFPMNVSVKGNELIIKNFLGEKVDRKAKLIEGVSVKVEKDIVVIESHDKEKAGQTAANIEKTTRVKNKDRRIFQDGIILIEREKGAKRW